MARCSGEGGFTYLGVLIALAILGMMAVASVRQGGVLRRHAAEEALLAVGQDFRDALRSYADATPAGLPRTPRALQDLLRDPRYPGVRRHLRHVPFDPMTGGYDWGLVMTADGTGILGIYSKAPGHPIKTGNFPPAYRAFADKASYKDWVFTQAPPRQPSRVTPSGPTSTMAPSSLAPSAGPSSSLTSSPGPTSGFGGAGAVLPDGPGTSTPRPATTVPATGSGS